MCAVRGSHSQTQDFTPTRVGGGKWNNFTTARESSRASSSTTCLGSFGSEWLEKKSKSAICDSSSERILLLLLFQFTGIC